MPSTRIEDSHFEKTGRTADADRGGRGKREEIRDLSMLLLVSITEISELTTRVDYLSKSATSYLKKKYPAHTKAIAACAIAATT